MSDQTFDQQPDEDGFGVADRTPEQQEVAAVNLDDPESTDDVPWSPPDRAPIHAQFPDDPAEETIDQRIAQEVPEDGTAYGAPEPEGILGGADDLAAEGWDGQGPDEDRMVGGDDPDAIPADRDILHGGV